MTMSFQLWHLLNQWMIHSIVSLLIDWVINLTSPTILSTQSLYRVSTVLEERALLTKLSAMVRKLIMNIPPRLNECLLSHHFPVKCTPPIPTTNVNIDYDSEILLEGSQIQFSCPQDHVLSNRQVTSATCTEAGDWEPDPSNLHCQY